MQPKRLKASQLKEDLLNGLTRFKKDDIGFGSLEKKYNLTTNEMAVVLTHPALKDIETVIPDFIIEDDVTNEEVVNTTYKQEENTPLTAKIEVAQTKVVKPVEKTEKLEAFI